MNDDQDFTTGSIPKKMIKFMLPILGAIVLQAMYSAVDLMIVGRFGSTAGISGVATLSRTAIASIVVIVSGRAPVIAAATSANS